VIYVKIRINLKIGVIGVGYWGKKHVDEYVNLGHEVIVSDNRDENLTFCEDKYGVSSVQNLEEILQNDEIKCVSICTPNHTHYNIAKEFISKGKHVFLEKPITTTVEDATNLINLSKKNNVLLQVGHIYRFNNAIEKTKEIIKNAELGTIFCVNFLWNNFEPVFDNRGIVIDLGLHPIDIVDNIFGGEYQNISCRGWGFRQQNSEFAIINYKLNTLQKDPIFVNIELSWLNPIRKREMTIIGSKKTLHVECVNQQISLIDNISKSLQKIHIPINNTLRDELEFFINSISNNQSISKPKPNGEVAKHILEILLDAEDKKID